MYALAFLWSIRTINWIKSAMPSKKHIKLGNFEQKNEFIGTYIVG